ncbi:hypothetical protein EWP40_24590, partial [Salmonella enterica]|nr:hypothetical protein [Salmonella enterica]
PRQLTAYGVFFFQGPATHPRTAQLLWLTIPAVFQLRIHRVSDEIHIIWSLQAVSSVPFISKYPTHAWGITQDINSVSWLFCLHQDH